MSIAAVIFDLDGVVVDSVMKSLTELTVDRIEQIVQRVGGR
jgi:beta-phosphoglucomutase-like phosphatase (HAD superfamily)